LEKQDNCIDHRVEDSMLVKIPLVMRGGLAKDSGSWDEKSLDDDEKMTDDKRS
jgi:hypothetical protein